MNKKLCLFFFLINLLFNISCKEHSGAAQDGIFDLRNHNFEEFPIVDLDGQWELYWQKLYQPEDFQINSPEKTGFIKVPSTWNGRIINGTKLSGHGYATYRALILLPPGLDKEMELRIGEINSSYKVFVNGRQAVTKGIVGTSVHTAKPEWDNALLRIKTDLERVELIIQVSNYDFITGGIGYKSISIGKEGSLTAKVRKWVALEILLAALLASLGSINLLFFLVRRKDYAFLWLFLLCFSFVIAALTTGERELYLLFFPNNFKIITSFAHFPNYSGFLFIFLFVTSVFPGEVPKKIFYPIVLYYSVITAFVIIFPANIYSYTMLSNIIVNSLISIYITVIFIKAVKKKREGARFFLTGWLLVLAVTVIEVMGIFEVIPLPDTLPLAAVFFVIFHTILLAVRYSRALTDSQHLTENLIAVNKLKDDFLAKTSHEFRTPLHAIMGIANSMLEDKEQKIKPENRTNLEVIVQSSKRLAFLVNDILDFYKMKHSSLQLRQKPVNIYAITNTVLTLITFLNPGKSVEIINDIPPDLEAVYADEYRIQQILLNLLDNSLKHTAKGSIHIQAEKRGEQVRITVTDTGKGIPREKQDHIFSMFEKFDRPGNEQPGSGIGLAITKQLVELHNGNVFLESAPDKGTTISFTLPVYTGGEKAVKLVREKTEAAISQELTGKEIGKEIKGVKKETILIVDDEISNIQVLQNYIKNLGFSYRIELTGTDALDYIDKEGHSLHLVILDVSLPDLNGYEVCQRIRENYSLYELPVLMVTARANNVDIVAGFEAGANDYITKPFDKDEFLARVKTLIKLYYVLHANKDLEKNSILKQLFLSMLSHDIREPLMVLQFALEDLKGQNGDNELINILYSETFYLEQLAERFLKLAKIENGNITCVKIDLDPFAELKKLVNKNRVIGKRKQQNIAYEPQGDEGIKIRADKDLFISIFNNILNNAMKYGPKKKIISVKAGIVSTNRQYFRVEVKNQGDRLSEPITIDLFNDLSVLQTKPTGGEPSSKVGLYIVKQLVDLHEGKMEFINNPTGGLTVIVDLPVLNKIY